MNTTLARKLRKTSTLTEKKLWERLRDNRFQGLKFRRQFPIDPYIVDLVCLSHKLIIELDGGQHAEQVAYDEKRTQYLEQLGFKVLRYWNHDVLNRMDVVLEHLRLNIDV